MTTDEKVKLARQLAEALLIKRSEWQRWVNYFVHKRNLDKALKLAEYLSRSPAVRSEPKKAAQIIREQVMALKRLSLDDLAEVFGYVSRELEWLNYTRRGEREEATTRYPRGKSGSRYRSH